MAVPKGFKKDIKITSPETGLERRKEMYDDIANKGGFIPKGVSYEDMDKTFVESMENDFKLTIEGQEVPVYFFTSIQRWTEFHQTWKNGDEYRDVKIPFITIIRQTNPEPGSNQAGNWNIPGRKTYTYMRVPTYDGNRKGVDVYKIPQPVSVDINYQVRLFCNKMRDLNKFHSIIEKNFQSRQFYIRVNDHPMPVHLEATGDESQMSDFENRRYYVQTFDMKLLGYLLDEEEFEVVPAVNRMLVLQEIEGRSPFEPQTAVKTDEQADNIYYTFIFKPNSNTTFSFYTDYDIRFNEISNIVNINNIDISVDGNNVTIPFVVNSGQKITVNVAKDLNDRGEFVLKGQFL